MGTNYCKGDHIFLQQMVPIIMVDHLSHDIYSGTTKQRTNWCIDHCPLFGGCPLCVFLSKRLLIMYCIGNSDIFYV